MLWKIFYYDHQKAFDKIHNIFNQPYDVKF